MIVAEILETDYKYKKGYQPRLFDQKNKKNQITSTDLLTYLRKHFNDFLKFGQTLKNN